MLRDVYDNFIHFNVILGLRRKKIQKIVLPKVTNGFNFKVHRSTLYVLYSRKESLPIDFWSHSSFSVIRSFC